MVEVPEPGTGTVSLNLPGNNATKTEAITSDVAPEPTGNAFAIPVVDTDEDITSAVPDLAASGGGITQVFKQANLRTWAFVLTGALLILAVVFVVLARQTSLFQGNLQGSLEDETIIESPTTSYTNFDTNQDNTDPAPTGGNTNNVDTSANGSNDSLPAQSTELAPGTENDPNAILSQLLGLNSPDELTNTNNSQTNEPIVDNGPVVDSSPAVNDPEFDNSTVNVTPQSPTDNEPVILSPTPNGANEPVLGNIDVTPTQPISPLPQPVNTQQNTAPSLGSNTNANVLASAQVSGNTGPGLLVYFGAPTLAYFLRKKKR